MALGPAEALDSGAAGPGPQLLQPASTFLGPCQLSSAAAPAWQLLRTLLERYGGGQAGGTLALAAAEAVLSEAGGTMALPRWLLDRLEGLPGGSSHGGYAGMAGAAADPAALLRLYLQHGCLEEAAVLVLAHLAAWEGTNALSRGKPMAVWLPTRAIEALQAQLVAAGSAEAPAQGGLAAGAKLRALAAELEKAAAQHAQLVRNDAAFGIHVRA